MAKNEIDEIIGNRIRLQRKLRGWSLQKLGDELGISYQQVQKYEKGINSLSATKLLRLAGVFSVSIPWFYGELAEEMQLPYDPSIIRTAHKLASIKAPKRRKTVLSLIEQLAD